MSKNSYHEDDYEEAFIALLRESGWTHTRGDDLHRRPDECLIEDDLRRHLLRRYAADRLTCDEANAIIANLRNTGKETPYLTLRAVVSLYRDGYLFERAETGETLWVDYVDFDRVESNTFRVVNQFAVSYNGGRDSRRPDVLLFVNGIPVCIVELKNPADERATIAAAHEQIHMRYRRDIPHLLKYCALSCLSDASNTRLGTTYTPYVHYYAWKKVENEDRAAAGGVPELRTLIEGALRPDRLLALLRDFCYFPDAAADKEEEVVCRYPQFFATRKLLAHIESHARGNGGDGKGGTYFGATGCGKTYTMVFLARQLALRSPIVKSPTIIIIVDRDDLQSQSGRLMVNSSDFLACGTVRVIADRDDLRRELSTRTSGGLFVCTIQKFCEATGLLSARHNIVCFSDEAHRSQTGLGSKLRIVDGTEKTGDGKARRDASPGNMGAFVTYGFAKYLRDAFPNATYVGFTGTPIDETIHVFGDIVDRYTMGEAVRDQVTVSIKYVPRLARVLLDKERAKAIEDYYAKCYDEGASDEDIRKSKEAMASLEVIIGDPGRLRRLATDVAEHYERTCAEQPELTQKAMIACSNRQIAFHLYQLFREIRPAWFEPKRSADESRLAAEELEKLTPLPALGIVATRGANDPKELYDALGDKAHRDWLAAQFKDERSNFRIVIVVDMWITGFDVPCLSVLYNDKPLQKHTLVQTISRVNRKFQVVVKEADGSERIVEKPFGLIVDYIGIHERMKEALKLYGGDGGELSGGDLETSHKIFAAELQLLRELMHGCDLSDFFSGDPLKRLYALQVGAEFVLAQVKGEGVEVSFQTRFRGHIKRLRMAYNICNPAGVLSTDEVAWAQCFMGICSYVSKATAGQHDVAAMNSAVEQMVQEAISCSGVEAILQADTEEEIFEDDFLKSLDEIKLPCTKFQVLARLLRRAIKEYARTNMAAAKRFEEMLDEIVRQYNNRDNDTFAGKVAAETVRRIQETVDDKVASLTDKILGVFRSLKKDKEKFKELGITFEEKAFFDILTAVRDEHGFAYDDGKCIALAQEIKKLIDNTAIYADWKNNDNLKADLADKMIDLLYDNSYPPEWNDDVYKRVMEQVDNFKENE